jgi:hypothetical protein
MGILLLQLWGQSDSCIVVMPVIGFATPERINWQPFELSTTDNGWTTIIIDQIFQYVAWELVHAGIEGQFFVDDFAREGFFEFQVHLPLKWVE